jgi:outer membrane protein insertion porin family
VFVLLALSLAGTAFAQLIPQGPTTAYEGQNVSAISLIANPHRDLTLFYPLVTQKAGEPYSQAKIEASAQKLKEAGNFPKVDVTIEPEITGLRVNFLLEPAYYIGVVKFPGAEKYFSYTRLLQIANLPDEEPYDPARIPLAEKALTKFLRQEGYFQATMHSESQIDDRHQLVNVNFTVSTGKQARIASVKLEGTDAAETARLMHAFESIRARLSGGLLKPGKSYNPGRIREATKLMKGLLRKQHQLAGTIRENPPQYKAENNRVDVSFKIEVGPVVDIRIVGAKLTVLPFLEGRQRRKLIPIYSEGAVDRDLVDEGQRNLVDYFQQKGYFDVKVTTEFNRQPDQIHIVYNIERGKKRKVGRIVFHGNYEVGEKDLVAQLAVKRSHIWTHGDLSQKVLTQTSDNIKALYADRGYEDAKVTPQTIEHEKKIDVIFNIEEGAQTIVENIQVSGNEHVLTAQLTAPKGFQLKAAAPFSPRKLTDDRNRISATYLDRGYPNADVKATANKIGNDPHRVKVSYAITEHQLVRIDDVVYLGQQHTRRSLIARTTHIPREAPMRRGQMLQAESQLYDLQIFDWASVGPEKPVTDQTNETALVKVHEAKRNEITYSFGFEVAHRGGNIPTGTVGIPGGGATIGLNGYQIAPSQETFASPLGSVQFTRINMRGLGESASASILLSQLDQKYLTTYSQPRFFGTQWKTLTSCSLERNSENPLFTAALGDISFQVEKLLNRKTDSRIQLRYDFNKTDLSHLIVPELVFPQDRNVYLSTVSATYLRDTRDKPLDAHKGSFTTVNFGVTPTAFGSSANFTKLFGQYAFYKPVHSVVLADSFRLGLASPFSGSFVPTSQLFFSGGGTTLRGFPIDEAGPQRLVPFCNVLQGQSGCVDVTVPVGGKQLFIFNSEVRFPLGIMKALGGVVFYDGGNVYSAINFNNFVNNYTSTGGVGLRYATPIGPVRFDIGKLLNPVPGISPWQYYITIGQAF